MINWLEVAWVKDGEGDIDLYCEPNASLRSQVWRPGNLVKLRSGEIHLVGTLNVRGGACDCCGTDPCHAVAYACPYPELAGLVTE